MFVYQFLVLAVVMDGEREGVLIAIMTREQRGSHLINDNDAGELVCRLRRVIQNLSVMWMDDFVKFWENVENFGKI